MAALIIGVALSHIHENHYFKTTHLSDMDNYSHEMVNVGSTSLTITQSLWHIYVVALPWDCLMYIV